MKRLTNIKAPSLASGNNNFGKKRHESPHGKNKKTSVAKNDPYPASQKPYLDAPAAPGTNGHLSFSTPPSGRSISYASPSQSKASIPSSSDGQHAPTIGNKSAAPTVSTNHDTVHSDAAHSKAGTNATVGGALSSSGVGGGEGSTFSSPAPSERSMTTTLTTMQSAAPSALLAAPGNQGHHAPAAANLSPTSNQTATAPTHFSHQFPSSPVSAIPPYLNQNQHASGGHPNTYTTATANNLLTDNASVMTLASSSKRRRRNSLDTNASVRAIAPSSVYGGSKESLPLSVLSASTHEPGSSSGHHQGQRQVSVNLANAERASVYSSSGIAPALPSERNSYYASKQAADGASVRSGLIGHSRNDSITRSIGGLAAPESPLNTPREAHMPGRISRRNSGATELSKDDLRSEDGDRSSLKSSFKSSLKT